MNLQNRMERLILNDKLAVDIRARVMGRLIKYNDGKIFWPEDLEKYITALEKEVAGGKLMKIRYKKEVPEMAEIELQVPYYYEEITDAEYKMFGVVYGGGVMEIVMSAYKKSTEVKIERYPDPAECIDYILSYCQESTKEKFEAAKKEAMEFLKEG